MSVKHPDVEALAFLLRPALQQLRSHQEKHHYLVMGPGHVGGQWAQRGRRGEAGEVSARPFNPSVFTLGNELIESLIVGVTSAVHVAVHRLNLRRPS